MGRLLDFLLSLDHVHVGPHSHLTFVWNYPGWIILGMLVLGFAGFASYWQQAGTVGQKRTLGVLRGLLLALVFMLLWRPEVIVDHEEHTRSVVTIWLDNSGSMQLEDPYTDPRMRAFVNDVAKTFKKIPGRERPNRYELALYALQQSKWLPTLTQAQDIAVFTGGAHAELLGVAHDPKELEALWAQLAKHSPTGETTNVPTVMNDITQEVQGQRISAMMILTDGQTTEVGARRETALAAVEKAGATIVSVPLGELNEPYDLKIASVEVPENTFVRDPVSVIVHVAATGVQKIASAHVVLYRQDGEGANAPLTPLAEKDITINPGERTNDVELVFKPEKTGNERSTLIHLIAKIESTSVPAVQELTLSNNQSSASTRVMDAQINVLYVEGYPRWEFRYLRNELIREKSVNVSTLLLSADEDFAQEGDPAVVDATGKEKFPGPIQRFPENAEELNKYDVILIGDVDPAYFTPAQQRLIVEFVGKGGGIGWISGNMYNPEAYKETALSVLLPVVPDEADPRSRVLTQSDNTPFIPLLTAAGRNSPMFRFFEDAGMNRDQMAALPPMYWYKPVLGLAPAAEVLAQHPTRTQGGSLAPLLVTGHYKQGRTLFSAYADTWRWRRYKGEPLFQSYWLQLCRVLYRNKALGEGHPLELVTDERHSEVGSPVHLALDVKDPTILGQMPSQVPVLVKDAHGVVRKTVMLTRSPTQQEHFEGLTTFTEAGNYSMNATPGSLPADMEDAVVQVVPPQGEFEKTGADVDTLTLLANKSSGAVIPVNMIDEAQSHVPDRSLTIPVPQSEELWYKPLAWILVIGLATAEWLLRKKAGLI